MNTPTPQQIRKLVEQIKAGGYIDWKAAGFRPDLTSCALIAWHGSLDAADVLHEELLPDWLWGISAKGSAWVSHDGWRFGGYHLTPARAWLIAILKAYAWKLEMEAGE